jgi:hypothetical protein
VARRDLDRERRVAGAADFADALDQGVRHGGERGRADQLGGE